MLVCSATSLAADVECFVDKLVGLLMLGLGIRRNRYNAGKP
jgi:hypothetical protein